MSAQSEIRRITVSQLARRKGGEPVVSLTAYSAPMARLVDEVCDITLVGDSLGMVLHGMDSTLGVTLEMMILHGQAVMRGARRACVIVDMPFGSYEESPQQAFANAVRVMREVGCQGIKLEGGREMAETIHFLVERGIPVQAHVGLLPQSVNLKGYRAVGRRREEWADIIADAQAVAEAGAFSTVLEGVAEPLAAEITRQVPNLTIGIGASSACDGQVLVTEDMLGLFERTPSFVRRYDEWGERLRAAAGRYAGEVRARQFPGPEHTYEMKE